MLGRGLASRAGAYAVFALGFWLLFQGFDRPNIFLGILGGAGVLLGMYLMVGAGKSVDRSPLGGEKEPTPPESDDQTKDQ